MTELPPDLRFLASDDNPANERGYKPTADNVWNFTESGFMAEPKPYCQNLGPQKLQHLFTDMITANCRPDDVGLDVTGGADGVALRELLDKGVLGRALVTNLQDRRSSAVKEDRRLDHIDGDLLLPKTWQRLYAWQQKAAPTGFGLILHRPYGALQNLSSSLYAGAAHILIDMLRPGGVFFTQVPGLAAGEDKRALCNHLRPRQDILDIRVTEKRDYWTGDQYALITKKLGNIPTRNVMR